MMIISLKECSAFGLIESDLARVSGANTLTGSRNGSQIFGSINYGKTIR